MALLSRDTATRPHSDRPRKPRSEDLGENGNLLSAMTGPPASRSITTPTWLVQEPVAAATSRNGLNGMRMKTQSPTVKSSLSFSTEIGRTCSSMVEILCCPVDVETDRGCRNLRLYLNSDV